MGAYLSFIAFKRQPDLAALAEIEWLTGYRLFKHRSQDEWYLEGPGPEPGKIDLSERLHVDPSEFSAGGGDQSSVIDEIETFLNSRDLRTDSLDDDGMRQAMKLTHALDTSALLAYGNDEGADAGFVYERGELVRARLLADSDKVLDFSAGAMNIEGIGDAAQGVGLYRVANGVATSYFEWPANRWISSDPFELEDSDFRLVASKGATEEFRRPGQDTADQKRAIVDGEGNLAFRLERYMRFVDGHVKSALKRELISAERRVRDAAEARISACYVAHYYDIYKEVPSIESVNRFLGELGKYFLALRPKPQYRRDIDFDAARRRLRRRWQMLKLRMAIYGWLKG